MKKRSLSHFAYYAANRAFPVFLLLLLLLGFTACSAEKGAKVLDYPAMFGETKDEVLAALDAENLTYKEDDLYANAYVLDRTETLESRDFSVYLLFDLNTDTLYGYRRVLFVENPTDADSPTSCHRPVRAASRPISSTSTTAAVSPEPAAARAYPPSWPAPGLSG